MLEDYLIVHKSILPPYFEEVIKARELFENGEVSNISEAVKKVGISRSTYYKYKDYIFQPSNQGDARKAVISMMLSHETGVLSAVLSQISESGASILTIDQSLPINGKANVTVTLDISSLNQEPSDLIEKISSKRGVDNPRLLAIE